MKLDRLLAFVLILAFVIRVLVVVVPAVLIDSEFLISNSIALDDAFITFKIAKNVHNGMGFSFDNIEKTNASPFVWTYLLSPFGFLGNEAFVIFALILCSLFFTISGYFLYEICMVIFKRRELAIITVFLYLFNPFFVLISLNGLETSLFVFLLLFSFHYYISRIRKGDSKLTNFIFFSILLALTAMTRDDGVYVFLAFLIDYVFIFKGLEFKGKLKNFSLILILFIIFVSPMFVSRYLEFGYFTGSNAYYYSSLFAKDLANNLISALSRKAVVFAMTVSVMSLMAGSIVLSFLGFFISKRSRDGLNLLYPLIIFSLLELFQYSMVMPILRLRYILAATIILILGTGILLSHIKRISKGVFYVSFLALLLVLSYFTAAIWTGYTDIGDSDIRVGILLNRHVINAAKFMEDGFPNSRIGVSHIGTFAYFSPHTIISDRNGKTSYEATDYNMQGRIDEYFEKRGVEYLAGFFSKENLGRVIESDIIFSEPVDQRLQLKFKHEFGYYAVVRFRKDYVSLMTL
ncbi:MAG: hypothetical protein GTN76_06445 [Candidatus Aenigmarchaeota archaeon]|nr:hypothetical protein [Candidatus Aenigmarchaeota archaeon]